jgi:GntR family transcriptional regulator/MocR family aminotransferase
VGFLRGGIAESDAAARAWTRRITVVPLQRFSIAPIDTTGLVLGFSGVGSAEIRKGVGILAELLGELSPRPAPSGTPG